LIPSIQRVCCEGQKMKYISRKREICSFVPANAVALEDATASPGINVLSSISRPNKSRSNPEPQNPFSKFDTSSRTALKQVIQG